MKKILLVLSLFSSILFAETVNIEKEFTIESECDKVFEKTAFTICYDYENKQPKWGAYILTYKEVKGHNKRPDNAFKEDLNINLKYRSTLSDYRGSGMDRGHIVPNASVDYDTKAQMESFLLSNISPQYPRFNQGIWSEIENEIRDYTKNNKEIFVVTGSIIEDKNNYIGNKVTIPSYFYKVVYSPSKRKGIAYLVPHKKDLNKNSFKSYKTNIEEVEKLTGIKFFSNIKNTQFKKFDGYF